MFTPLAAKWPLSLCLPHISPNKSMNMPSIPCIPAHGLISCCKPFFGLDWIVNIQTTCIYNDHGKRYYLHVAYSDIDLNSKDSKRFIWYWTSCFQRAQNLTNDYKWFKPYNLRQRNSLCSCVRLTNSPNVN